MKPHSDITKRRAFRLIDGGQSKLATARQLGVDRTTLYKWLAQRQNDEKTLSQKAERIARFNEVLPPPLFAHELPRDALRALDDFGYWRYRYLGRRSTPWQEEAAESVVRWIASDQSELIVVNCPPGSGKSTLFTHDIPLWMICRDRTIRILLGHAVSGIAETYTRQLRRALQRTRPLAATHKTDAATGCLAEDYGRFKPPNEEAWRMSEFTVMMSIDEDHADESGLESKEATVQSFGFDSEYLGTRANLVVWDDLVTGDVLQTKERIEKQRRQWDEEGETRLEPGGALLLVGQRMGADDLFGYCTNQKLPGGRGRYRHVVYQAHDDEHCHEDHGSYRELDDEGNVVRNIVAPDAKPWPEGCLLDPVRLPWHGAKGLAFLRESKPSVYEVQYQQRDTSSTDVLVPRVWIDGGLDPVSGETYPGCWDRHRRPGTMEGLRGLSAPYYSFITADPSATNFWAVIWWIYHPASEQLFLIDIFNDRMTGPELLDYNVNDGVWFGVLQDWWSRSVREGAPISHIIVEVNACQKWLLQFEHAKQWSRRRVVQFVSHTTGINKLDPHLGIESVAPKYRFGNIRLPGAIPGPSVVDNLVREATRYEPSRPKAHTDDTLMATWFAIWHLSKLHRPRAASQPRLPRPSWVKA